MPPSFATVSPCRSGPPSRTPGRPPSAGQPALRRQYDPMARPAPLRSYGHVPTHCNRARARLPVSVTSRDGPQATAGRISRCPRPPGHPRGETRIRPRARVPWPQESPRGAVLRKDSIPGTAHCPSRRPRYRGQGPTRRRQDANDLFRRCLPAPDLLRNGHWTVYPDGERRGNPFDPYAGARPRCRSVRGFRPAWATTRPFPGTSASQAVMPGSLTGSGVVG